MGVPSEAAGFGCLRKSAGSQWLEVVSSPSGLLGLHPDLPAVSPTILCSLFCLEDACSSSGLQVLAEWCSGISWGFLIPLTLKGGLTGTRVGWV